MAMRRRAQILGRMILLAYRFSGGVPAVLASANLCVESDCVRLEVGAAARAPDSEVVGDRLKLLAAAIGVRRSEIVVVDEKS
jgi:exopolyphosphatase/guanosine-5'-triphosphate,3'-diphosphate pyrophosphatase